MTKNEAIELLASGETLTEEQRKEIADVLRKTDEDDGDWYSSTCWDESSC